MRYRKLSPTGDYVFGQQQSDFHVDVPEAVAQAVQTRLRLHLGDWFLNVEDGMDWQGSVLGNRTAFTRDAAIHARVVQTPGVVRIDDYSSGFESNTRNFVAQLALDTIYGKFVLVKQSFEAIAAGSPLLPEQPFNVDVDVISDTQITVSWEI